MRHFPPSGPITSLTLGVVHTAGAAALIPRPGRAPRRPPCGLGAVRAAVAVAAVAVAADRHLTATASAVEQAGGRGHRQLLPMSPGSSPTSGRYLPTARATHGPGYGTGEDCGGRDQCRTCLNGTDAVDHGAVLVISRSDDTRPRALPLGRAHVRRRYQARGPRRRWAGCVPGCATLRRGRTQPSAAATPVAGSYATPFSLAPNPPSSPSDRPVFTTRVGDDPRYPPTIRRFG